MSATDNAPSVAFAPTNVGAPTIPAALASFDALPDSAYVRMPTVIALKDISAATAWRWVKSGHLPPPVKLGPNTTAWRVGDLRRHAAGDTGAASPARKVAPAGKPAWTCGIRAATQGA